MLLGDSDFPETPGSGGSCSAASTGAGLFDACTNLRARLTRRLGVVPAAAVFAQGRVSAAGKSKTLGTLAREASGKVQPGAMTSQLSQQA